MKVTASAALALLAAAYLCTGGQAMELKAGALLITLDDTGRLTRLHDTVGRREVLAPGQKPPLLTCQLGGRTVEPTTAAPNATGSQLRLGFGDGGPQAVIAVAAKPTHLRLELAAWEGPLPTRLTWGPWPTTICQSVGGTIGVLRDEQTALGIQALNVQTRGSARRNGEQGLLTAEAVEHEGGIRGSAVALFGCAAADALATIGKIEIAEGLPHPMLDGQWGKTSPTAREPYLVGYFGEKDFDAYLDLAQKAGIRYLYHAHPFKTWGHFQLIPELFPDGEASLRRCVAKAAQRGVRVGVHTLSGFITTNDPYVTPVPDPRLARMGSSTLTAAVDEKATEIGVADPAAFRNRQTLGAALLGTEIIQYGRVSEQAPWQLLDCTRGAFGTATAAHAAGADIGKLADHGYRTLYPSLESGMMDEMAGRLAQFVRDNGLRQMSFDGLEGISTYGYPGDAIRAHFVKYVYDRWQHEVISDASNLLHYNWHIHTRMNWGELTQSAKTDVDVYRAGNCDYFEANLFPCAMGWWRFGGPGLDWEATRLEDVEYLLAKAAGYRATHGLETSPGAVAAHGYGEQCLQLVRDWTEASTTDALSDAQRRKLREKGRDFHLARVGERGWTLSEVRYSPFFWACPGKEGLLSLNTADDRTRGMTSAVNNPFGEQPLQFELRLVNSFDYASDQNLALNVPAAAFAPHHQLPEGAAALQMQGDTRGGLTLSASYHGPDPRSRSVRSLAAFPQALNLRQHRGLGLFVEGDGQGELLFIELVARDSKRQYYVPLSFTGRRYVEFPCGEMSLQRYYAYDWGGAGGFAAWWNTLKGFDYGHVEQITVGFNSVPRGQTVSCRISGLMALRELGSGVANFALRCGGRQLQLAAPVPPGAQYLTYSGGDAVEARDGNYRLLSALPATGDLRTIPPGESAFDLSYEGNDAPAPWTRIEYKCVGPAEAVAAPRP
ncbi:hypothetical protein LLH23_04760 [bacterium]|nr:hypothetical protein [bacterium]